MDMDGVFRVIGELGRQQLVYVAYLLMLNTYAAFHMIQVLHASLYFCDVRQLIIVFLNVSLGLTKMCVLLCP